MNGQASTHGEFTFVHAADLGLRDLAAAAEAALGLSLHVTQVELAVSNPVSQALQTRCYEKCTKSKSCPRFEPARWALPLKQGLRSGVRAQHSAHRADANVQVTGDG